MGHGDRGIGGLPDNEGRVEHHTCDHEGEDDARHETQHGVGVREGHDGQANVLGEQQSRSLEARSELEL